MKAGIMQPYLFPYLGYFQLIHAVEVFVIYDDVQYIKQGWINRNRILLHHEPQMFTFPVRKGSHRDFIKNRYYNGDTFESNKKEFLKTVYYTYKKAREFPEVFPLLQRVLEFPSLNIAEFNTNSLKVFCDYLGIRTEFVIASHLPRNGTLKGQDAVIEINEAIGSDCYINPKNGVPLYSQDVFRKHGIELGFIEMNGITYPQFGREFVPSLSIIDVLMFNSKQDCQKLLNSYILTSARDLRTGAIEHIRGLV